MHKKEDANLTTKKNAKRIKSENAKKKKTHENENTKERICIGVHNKSL